MIYIYETKVALCELCAVFFLCELCVPAVFGHKAHKALHNGHEDLNGVDLRKY
jgi:hypothetical protein